MSKVTVRDAIPSDACKMAELDKICFAVPWSVESFADEIESNDMAVYIIAEADEVLAGYAGMWCIIDEGHITNVAVASEFRRQGIASAILEALIAKGREMGIRAFTLEVRASNTAAQELYSKFGFKSMGYRPGYYEDNKEAAMIMWLIE